MTRQGRIGLIVGCLAAALLVAGLFARAAMRRVADRRLVMSGAVEADDVSVGSLVGGRVAKVLVREGDRVTAGESLVTLETDLLDRQASQQQARVEGAEAALALATAGPRREEVSRARLDAAEAERERRRLAELFRQGVVSAQERDRTATRAATAGETLRQLEGGSRPEDVEAARAAVAREREQLSYVRRQIEESVVRSPADAVVETLDLRPGDIVAAGAPVASLLEPSQLWVRVYVPEPSLGRVHVGDAATIRVDTWPDRRFPGHVEDIRQRGEYTPRNLQTLAQRQDEVFAAKVRLEPSPDLHPGMSALVTLEPPAP